MIKLSTLPYYCKTLFSIGLYSSWWKAPLLLLKKPIQYSIPLNLSFFVSNLMDIWTLQEVIIDQQYERFRQIPRNGVVLDIGGSIGDFSIFATKIRKAKLVHSYELNPERISLFKKNVRLNNASNIILHEKPALSLEAVFKECKFTQVDFMKIDCEGGEYPIFAKAPLSILKKISTISFEVHFFTDKMKAEYPKLKKLLVSSGFRIYEVKNPVHDTIGFLYAVRN